jgi:hypothetical protein
MKLAITMSLVSFSFIVEFAVTGFTVIELVMAKFVTADLAESVIVN